VKAFQKLLDDGPLQDVAAVAPHTKQPTFSLQISTASGSNSIRHVSREMWAAAVGQSAGSTLELLQPGWLCKKLCRFTKFDFQVHKTEWSQVTVS